MSAGESKGLLTAWMDIPAEIEEEFHAWYNSEHLYERMTIPGFLNAQRYLSVEGKPKYFTIYEVENSRILYSEPYLSRRRNPTPWTRRIEGQFQNFVRNIYDEICSFGLAPPQPAPYVQTVRTDIPPELEDEFNVWYNEERIPALLSLGGVYSARRYRAVEGIPKYLAIYELASLEVVKSDAWAKSEDRSHSPRIVPNLIGSQHNIGKLLIALP